MIIFDCETAPLPAEKLASVKPVFKPNRTLKDPEKIKADLAAKELAWMDDAALDGKYGQVLAIGLLDTFEMEAAPLRILAGPEKAIIAEFWSVWNDGPKIVGFCIKSFDLPFLVQRSWILGLPVPKDLLEGRYWNRRIVDLQEIWTCFGYRTEGQSLDAIAKATGIGAKTGNGKDFAHLFATDRKAALDYLGTDLELCAKLAARLGVQ